MGYERVVGEVIRIVTSDRKISRNDFFGISCSVIGGLLLYSVPRTWRRITRSGSPETSWHYPPFPPPQTFRDPPEIRRIDDLTAEVRSALPDAEDFKGRLKPSGVHFTKEELTASLSGQQRYSRDGKPLIADLSHQTSGRTHELVFYVGEDGAIAAAGERRLAEDRMRRIIDGRFNPDFSWRWEHSPKGATAKARTEYLHDSIVEVEFNSAGRVRKTTRKLSSSK